MDSPETSEFPPLLLTVAQVARLMGVSTRTVWGFVASGRMPGPVRIGRKLRRWKRKVIEEWIELGCPANWREIEKIACLL